jgi:hypothetical protein
MKKSKAEPGVCAICRRPQDDLGTIEEWGYGPCEEYCDFKTKKVCQKCATNHQCERLEPDGMEGYNPENKESVY